MWHLSVDKVHYIFELCSIETFLYIYETHRPIYSNNFSVIVLRGYYIIQFVARNLAGRASVIAGRDTTTAGWMIS